MSTKSFNEMTYEEKSAKLDSFLDGLKGEEWDRFLIDTEYELYKNITCPFLGDDFYHVVDIYNTIGSIIKIDLSQMSSASEMKYEFIYKYTISPQSENHVADNYEYKLAA